MEPAVSDARRLPDWWVRFTDLNPAVGSAVAICGLAIIAWVFLTPLMANTGGVEGNGQFVDTLATLTGSNSLVDRAVAIRESYHARVPSEIRDWLRGIYGNVALYLVIPFVWFLEWLFPAKRDQPLIGRAFWQDAIWFVMMVPTRLVVVGATFRILSDAYNQHLSFLTLTSAATWPVYVQGGVAVLMSEFLNWFNHWVRHKSRHLWLFHAVHHSQREMNVFTDDRGHVFDRLAATLIMIVPLLILPHPSLAALSAIFFYGTIHDRFIHANVKINLGWLSWIFVSPQFHRVHHSAEPAHADTNFGAFLSIFDHLFGTAYPSRTIYPQTGIDDEHFPMEDRVSVRQLPANWLRQTIYPFGQLVRQFRA